MQPEDLMNPDMLSEIMVLVSGTVIFVAPFMVNSDHISKVANFTRSNTSWVAAPFETKLSS